MFNELFSCLAEAEKMKLKIYEDVLLFHKEQKHKEDLFLNKLKKNNSHKTL